MLWDMQKQWISLCQAGVIPKDLQGQLIAVPRRSSLCWSPWLPSKQLPTWSTRSSALPVVHVGEKDVAISWEQNNYYFWIFLVASIPNFVAKSTVFNRERYTDFKKGIDKSETAGDRTLVDGDSGGVFRGVWVVVRKLRKHWWNGGESTAGYSGYREHWLTMQWIMWYPVISNQPGYPMDNVAKHWATLDSQPLMERIWSP